MDILDAGAAIRAGLALSDLTLHDLWQRYVEASGSHTLDELRAYVCGDAVWTAVQHNIAAQTLNDYFTDHGLDHMVAYADDL
jgi:hypothetical protein